MNNLTKKTDSAEMERRKHPRLSCSIPATIEINNNYYAAATVNISTGGCLIKPKDDISKLSDTGLVGLSFELPYTAAQIETKGRITRYDNNTGSIAMKFFHFTDDSVRKIGQYVRDFKNDY